VGQKLGAQANSQHGPIVADEFLEEFEFGFQEWVFIGGQIGNAQRPAEDDEDAQVIQIGRDFIAAIEMTDFGGDSEIAKDGNDSAGPLVFHMLQNDRFAHAGIRRLSGEDVKRSGGGDQQRKLTSNPDSMRFNDKQFANVILPRRILGEIMT
jgi:hypothetical protein